MIKLPQTTLLCVEAKQPELAVKVLDHCRKDIVFWEIVLVTPRKVDTKYRQIIYPLDSYEKMSEFFVKKLAEVELLSDYVLTVHCDGFIINPHNWTDEFLYYDYVAAPWKPDYPSKNRVGCGAFTLRSRKFIEACYFDKDIYPSSIPKPHSGEDYWTSCIMYDKWKKRGIKYATLDVAMKWALEYEIPECKYNDSKCFGFHKFTNQSREKYKSLLK